MANSPFNPTIVVSLMIAMLLVSCTGQQHEQHIQQLEELERMNRADSLMTNDTLALALVSYFDDHGTPNERMRAHYILGRTYADLGEAPDALNTYNGAAECADTTDNDCDYRTLARVYAQKAELFYYQLLPERMIAEEQTAMKYAMTAKDTMLYIACSAMLAEGYDMKGVPDSALLISEKAYQLYKDVGENALAAGLCCSLADMYRQRKDYRKAIKYMDEYELHSGFFDDSGNLMDSRKNAYYYIKGLLCLETADMAAAELIFRKLLNTTDNYGKKMAACEGLFKYYQANYNKDSLIKYCTLSDSLSMIAHNEIEMQKTLQVNALYDYTKNERIAHEKIRETDRLRYLLIIASMLIVIVLLVFAYVYKRNKDKKTLLENRIALLSGYTVNQRLIEHPMVNRIKQNLKKSPYETPDFKELKELHALINKEIPTFRTKLNCGSPLNDFEFDVCLLIKTLFSSSEIARIKQCSPAYITQTRKRIYKKIFKKEGRADELNEYIMSVF